MTARVLAAGPFGSLGSASSDAAPRFKLLAANSVKKPTNASLAASDGDLFLRTDKSLWGFAASK